MMFNLYWHCFHCKASKVMMSNLKSVVLTPKSLQPKQVCKQCGQEVCVLIESELDSTGTMEVLEIESTGICPSTGAWTD